MYYCIVIALGSGPLNDLMFLRLVAVVFSRVMGAHQNQALQILAR